MSDLHRFMSALQNPKNSGPTQPLKPVMSTHDIPEKETDAVVLHRTNIFNQCNCMIRRINADAKAMLSGHWEDVKGPYEPKKVVDASAPQWRHEVQRQEKLTKWLAAARKPTKSGGLEESQYRAIMKMREDVGFFGITKKIPPPDKPASMNTPPQPAPARLPVSALKPASLPVRLTVKFPGPSAISTVSLKRKAPGDNITNTDVKKEVIDLDEEDGDPFPELEQSDYEPEDEASAKHESCAKKRQRATQQQFKRSASEEDLGYQIEELRLKHQLQVAQLRRKMAALKRRKEESK